MTMVGTSPRGKERVTRSRFAQYGPTQPVTAPEPAWRRQEGTCIPAADSAGRMIVSCAMRWESFLMAVGLTWTLLTGDKLGLVIAFGGVTLLAYGVLRSRMPETTDDEPPIF